MKIGSPAETPTPATVTTGAAPAPSGNAANAPAVAAPADASAKIELSNTASALLSGGTPAEFDAEKVARIAQAIEQGTFKINPEAIADKLIANAQELLSKVGS